MYEPFYENLNTDLQKMKESGKYKTFQWLETPTAAKVTMENRGEILVLSSNNYLGLANHPEVISAGQEALGKYGAGTSSVRFICGSFTVHRELEERISHFFGTEAALTYVACWNANTGLIPTIAGPDDVLICDQLNHASLIDACRMATKSTRKVYRHADMDDLEKKLKNSENNRYRFIVTDGVFSMEGDLAPLDKIVELAQQYNAITIVDDSHGTGVVGKTGRGTAEHFGVIDEIDILTSTLGKALGGAAGGFVAGRQPLIDQLSQSSRPQIFSNALPPTVAASSGKALEILEREPERVEELISKTAYFRNQLNQLGFKPLDGDSAIIPIIIGETSKAIAASKALLEEGLFVTGFGYPVVPEGTARIRVQISYALTKEILDEALEIFQKVGKQIGLVS